MSEMPEAPFRRPPPSRLPIIAAVVGLTAAGGYLVYRFLDPSAPPPPPLAAAPEPAPAPPAPAAPEPAPDAGAAPALLQAISANPLYRACLAGNPPERRWAQLTGALEEGVVPAKLLACARPTGAFQVERRNGRLYAAAASHARYDRFAEAVGAVDAKALARAYQALHGPLEAAYRALGYPQGSLDKASGRVLGRILRAPVQKGDPELVEAGGTLFAFADPKLEALGDVEKQLLRMGAKNAGIVQAKAREVSEALGIPPTAGRKK